MDLRTLLGRVDLIHLERRNCGSFVGVEVEGLARGEGMRPVARADIIACADTEFSGRRKESVDSPNINAFLRQPRMNG